MEISPNYNNGLETLQMPRRRLTMGQSKSILQVERAVSVVSMVGCLFIIGSFLFFDAPKKKSFNRLLFFASWGNLMSNVATFIGSDGTTSGPNSATCKLQATLIQWFMPADCLWTFCMAVNVFLTFQTTSISVNIKKLEKWYFVFCFGLPAVPALTFLLLDVIGKNQYYGDATLWCWIRDGRDNLRLFTFYAPVWLIIIVTLALYAITGRAIYQGQVRNHLMRDALNSEPEIPSQPRPQTARTVSPIPPRLDVVAQTEISQTFEPVSRWTPDSSLPTIEHGSQSPSSRTSMGSIHHATQAKFFPIRVHHYGDRSIPNAPQITHVPTHASTIPISVSAMSSTDHLSDPTVTTTIFTIPSTPIPSFQNTRSTPLPHFRHSRNPSFETRTNRGAKTYAQVAFLLFIVMLCVWVPSTANRVYGVVHHKHTPHMTNFGLNMAAAVVLPLQGFFNTMIYIFTWRRELAASLRKAWTRMRGRRDAKELDTTRPEVKLSPYRPESREDLVISIDEDDDDKDLRYPWHAHPENASVIAVRVL